MVDVQTLEKNYDEGYKFDGTEHKIFDAVPKAINALKEEFLGKSRDKSETDAQKDLSRDLLVIYENGEEVAVINDIEQIKSLEYLTGEQKDFILMHFQFFEANLSVNLRKDYSESQDFNFCKAIGNNGCYNSLAVEKDDEGKVKSVLYSKKRLYGYGRDEQIMERAMDNKNLDQVYISIESDITSLKGEKVDKDTVLPKFKLTVSTVGHSELNSRELIFPKSIEESGINKADHQ